MFCTSILKCFQLIINNSITTITVFLVGLGNVILISIIAATVDWLQQIVLQDKKCIYRSKLLMINCSATDKNPWAPEIDRQMDRVGWYGDTKSVLEAKCTLPAELHKETRLNFTFPFPLADTLIHSKCSEFPLHFFTSEGGKCHYSEKKKKVLKKLSSSNIFSAVLRLTECQRAVNNLICDRWQISFPNLPVTYAIK